MNRFETERAVQRIISRTPHLNDAQELDRRRRRRRAAIEAFVHMSANIRQRQATLLEAFNTQELEIPNLIDINVVAELGAMGFVLEIGEQLENVEAFILQAAGRRPPRFQNVHDRAVNALAPKVVTHLLKDKGLQSDLRSSIESVPKLTEIDATADQRNNAILAIQTIYKHNAIDVSTSVHEIDMLESVYVTLRTLIEKGIVLNADVWTTFTLQLGEMVERNMIVCAKGRFQHLISITQGIDDSVPPIISDSATRSMFFERAGILRTNHLQTVGNLELYNSDDPAYLKRLRIHIRATLKTEFVINDNRMTEGAFEVAVAEVLDAI